MEKKRKRKTPGLPPEVWEQHHRTQRLLAERIAYHGAKLAEERAARDPQES
jgi:hypothetical protein